MNSNKCHKHASHAKWSAYMNKDRYRLDQQLSAGQASTTSTQDMRWAETRCNIASTRLLTARIERGVSGGNRLNDRCGNLTKKGKAIIAGKRS